MRLLALWRGLAALYVRARPWRFRLVPIMRGGEDPPADPPKDPPKNDPPAATFTQADVDRMVREAVSKATPNDYDELKKAKQRLDELEQANATELEKAQKRAEKAEQEAQRVQAEARETRLHSALLAEASKPERKVADPEAAVILLDRATLDLDEHGSPKNAKDALDALLKARPYLVAAGKGAGDVDQGARGGANQLSSTEGMTSAEIFEALNEGRLDEYLRSPRK